MPRAAGRVAPAFSQTVLPVGRVGVNPYGRQLTGLESWLWWEGPVEHGWDSPVVVGVAADCGVVAAPGAVAYRARLVGLVWRVGDGRPVGYASAGPGSEAAPAVRHVYRTKGRWAVRVSCVWRGGWGGTVTVPSAEREVEVVEVRARLTGD